MSKVHSYVLRIITNRNIKCEEDAENIPRVVLKTTQEIANLIHSLSNNSENISGFTIDIRYEVPNDTKKL